MSPEAPPSGPRWDRDALRDPHLQADKAVRVQAMFDAIAPAYERVNTVATLGRDAAWRRAARAAATLHPTDVVVDICCGTGDMLRVVAANDPPPARLIGVDFSAGMLAKVSGGMASVPTDLVRADALALPLAAGVADVITCAFGVRNFGDLQRGLREMHRVARPGARLVILEFASPAQPLARWLFQAYCNLVLPRLGALLSRDRTNAYRYLPRSIQTFETTRGMRDRLLEAGFREVTARRMNLGGVVLYRAIR
jgi:demethylmenaquinone methyltransferase / 2-methoxy-6-polyprenyl-1,4-benzoquinol methylase